MAKHGNQSNRVEHKQLFQENSLEIAIAKHGEASNVNFTFSSQTRVAPTIEQTESTNTLLKNFTKM